MIPKSPCKQCGSIIKPHLKLMRNDKYKLALDRRFCSDRCKGLSKGGYSKQAYSVKARAFLGDRCEACGSTENLIIHHANQDKSLNTKENCQTLCKYDHDRWHARQRRLGLKIAGRMPSNISHQKDENEFC